MVSSIEDRIRIASVAVIVLAALVFVAIRAPMISMPLERDEGEYAYIAQRLLEGRVPYEDAFDQKPPGVFAAYALAFIVFGQSIEGIHLNLYLWTAACGVFLFLISRRLAGELAAAFTVLAFAITTADTKLLATAANTEHFMLLPMVASVWLLLRALEDDRAKWWFLAGALAGGACWFKQVAVTNALFVAAYGAGALLLRTPRPSWRVPVRALALLLAGAIVVSIPVVMSFVLVGAWEPFIDSVLFHNLVYVREIPLPIALQILRGAIIYQAPSFFVFWLLAATGLLLIPRIGWSGWTLLVGWHVANFVGVSLGLHFRQHYFIQILPSMCVLVGVAAAFIASRLLARPSPVVGWVGVVILSISLIAPPVYGSRKAIFAEDMERRARQIYGINPFPESIRIAKHIERGSEPGESIYIIGSEPQIFFYAHRPSATRYIFFYPLTAKYPDVRERQEQVIREVEESEPRYIVWVNLAPSLLLDAGSERYVFESAAKLTMSEFQLEFVAFTWPSTEGPGFEFVYGLQAQRRLEELRLAGDPSRGWIAVYRRRR